MPNFSTPLSGLQAQSAAINTIGNNLANLNTTGFKASSVSFRDMVSASLGAASGQATVHAVGFGHYGGQRIALVVGADVEDDRGGVPFHAVEFSGNVGGAPFVLVSCRRTVR